MNALVKIVVILMQIVTTPLVLILVPVNLDFPVMVSLVPVSLLSTILTVSHGMQLPIELHFLKILMNVMVKIVVILMQLVVIRLVLINVLVILGIMVMVTHVPVS